MNVFIFLFVEVYCSRCLQGKATTKYELYPEKPASTQKGAPWKWPRRPPEQTKKGAERSYPTPPSSPSGGAAQRASPTPSPEPSTSECGGDESDGDGNVPTAEDGADENIQNVPYSATAVEMLKRMGYKKGEGLGASQQGIKNPIELKNVRKYFDKRGVGCPKIPDPVSQGEGTAEAGTNGREYQQTSAHAILPPIRWFRPIKSHRIEHTSAPSARKRNFREVEVDDPVARGMGKRQMRYHTFKEYVFKSVLKPSRNGGTVPCLSRFLHLRERFTSSLALIAGEVSRVNLQAFKTNRWLNIFQFAAGHARRRSNESRLVLLKGFRYQLNMPCSWCAASHSAPAPPVLSGNHLLGCDACKHAMLNVYERPAGISHVMAHHIPDAEVTVKCHIVSYEEGTGLWPTIPLRWRWSQLCFPQLYTRQADPGRDILQQRSQGTRNQQTAEAEFKIHIVRRGGRVPRITISELLPSESPYMIPPVPNPNPAFFRRSRHAMSDLKNFITFTSNDLERVEFSNDAVELTLRMPRTPFISLYLPLTSHGRRWFSTRIFRLTDLTAADVARLKLLRWP